MTPKQIGSTLRAARKSLGWTWNQAAKASGLKLDQVKGIEAGNKAYTVQSLMALAKALDHNLMVMDKGSDDVGGRLAHNDRNLRRWAMR